MKKSTILLVVLLISCTLKEENLTVVEQLVEFPQSNSSLKAIRERVLQSETGFVEISIEEDSLWVEGFVSSNDEGGNFFKELYVQDHPQNPETALRILIDRSSLVDYFPRGRKIRIHLNGLGAGLKSSILTLGEYQGTDIGEIPQFHFQERILPMDSLYSIQPKTIDLANILEEDIGKWVRVENVQFAKGEQGKTFSGEAFDEFDGERRLVQCKDQRSLLMSTSTFADYKSIVLSDSTGFIDGVLTRDFFGEKYILKINDPTNLVLNEPRCDPFFEENFEQVRLGSFDAEAWTNYNEAGSQLWEVFEDENSLGQSIQLGSYRSKDAATVSWLISPKIDVRQLQNPHLAFRTSTSFADSSNLEVYISTQWDGSISSIVSTTWEMVTVQIAQNDDDARLWIDSGDFPVQELGQFHLAFRYTGSGKTASDGTYEVDDIRVFEKTN